MRLFPSLIFLTLSAWSSTASTAQEAPALGLVRYGDHELRDRPRKAEEGQGDG